MPTPSSDVLTLGVNCAHDASACLLMNGEIRAAISEERLTKVKHQDGYPQRAISYCLSAAGVPSLNALTTVVVNKFPLVGIPHLTDGPCLCDSCYSSKIVNPSHHLLHAYYAWLASGFDETAILIADGSGYHYGEYFRSNSPCLGPEPSFSEMEEAESMYLARSGHIEVVEKRWGLWAERWAERWAECFRFPSLGHMFSLASQYIFGSWTHAGKTMGLAPYGDPHALPFQIVSQSLHGLTIDTTWIDSLPRLERGQPHHLVKVYRDLAAKVQTELETAILHLAKGLFERTQCPNLCISGGVALNSVANGRLLKEGPFKRVFITPAAGDSGIAIGAALYGHHLSFPESPRVTYRDDFHGTVYDNSEIRAVLETNSRIRYEYQADPAAAAAKEISNGRIVAWFEESSEFGPRALGHRSILADPRNPDMKDILNSRVKFREAFRPYGGSVLAERAAEYFDLNCASPYMLVVARLYSSKREIIPALCHIDGSCRIQTVDKQYNGAYRHLLNCFAEITGVPVLINTSFNIRGEPIVESPQDALECFLSCGIDVLYIGQYRVSKMTLSADCGTDARALVPYVNEGITLLTTKRAEGGGWREDFPRAQLRTGFTLHLADLEYATLRLVDGTRTVEEIAQLYSSDADAPLLQVLARLQQKGLISLAGKHGSGAIK